jgi:sugar/nucleoside kinase (ribokinase family)
VTTVAEAGLGEPRRRPSFLSIGSIFIDDIVRPDGRTHMAVLGGGATHAAMGMRVWSDRVGMLAYIGHDFPEADRLALARLIDLRRTRRRDLPSPRAWQLYEVDGRRTHVQRTSLDDFLAMCPLPEDLPADWAGAAGVRLDCDAPEPLRAWVARLRAEGCATVLWEPWNSFCRRESWPLFAEVAPLLDVVSPNLEQARRLTGLDDPRRVLAALQATGPRLVALRMGEAGSLVAGPAVAPVRVPAVTVDVVDVTGAGNAYCGGFLVGLAETGDPGRAGRYGAVSASFALEQVGAVFALDDLRRRAERRLSALAGADGRAID